MVVLPISLEELSDQDGHLILFNRRTYVFMVHLYPKEQFRTQCTVTTFCDTNYPNLVDSKFDLGIVIYICKMFKIFGTLSWKFSAVLIGNFLWDVGKFWNHLQFELAFSLIWTPCTFEISTLDWAISFFYTWTHMKNFLSNAGVNLAKCWAKFWGVATDASKI